MGPEATDIHASRFSVLGSCSEFGSQFGVRGSGFAVRGAQFEVRSSEVGGFGDRPWSLFGICLHLELRPNTELGTSNLEHRTWNTEPNLNTNPEPSTENRERPSPPSFPFNRRWWFRADVVDDAIDAADVVDNARRDGCEQVVRQA